MGGKLTLVILQIIFLYAPEISISHIILFFSKLAIEYLDCRFQVNLQYSWQDKS